MNARVTAWLGLAGLLRGAGARHLVPAAVLAVASGVLPVGFILAMGQVVGALWSAGGRSSVPAGVVAGLVVAVAAMVAQHAVEPLWTVVTTRVARSIDRRVHHRLIAGTLSAPQATVERGDVSDRIADATRILRQGQPTAGDGAAALLPLTARYLQLGAAVTVVGVAVSWLVAGPLLAAALLLRAGQRGALGRYFGRTWHGLAGERRRVFYLHGLGLDSVPAKEIRALGLTAWLARRTGEETRAYLEKTWRSRRAIYLVPFLRLTAVGMGVGVFVLVAVAQLQRREPDVVGLVVAAQATLLPLRFGRSFPECDVATEFGQLAHGVVTGLEREVLAGGPPVTGAREAPGTPPTIAFEHVHFRYPGAGHDVLRDVRLTLPAGRSTAIVGLNGAGKTTLTKLLAGFHEPGRGRITVDGQDLRELDLDSWRGRIAAITQNFTRFELSLLENVRLGAVGHAEDRLAVLDAIERANARDILESLPDGLDTVLSPRYRGGVGLSGGQWQRVALARTLYAVRQGASVVVLDEPTAQLDPRAEARFHDEFFDLTAGLTTVVIAHRFATVRRTDAIAVLAEGTVSEHGTHDELLAGRGTYAEMFTLQATRFDQVPG